MFKDVGGRSGRTTKGDNFERAMSNANANKNCQEWRWSEEVKVGLKKESKCVQVGRE